MHRRVVTPTLTRSAVVLCLAWLLLTACSSGSDDETAEATTEEPAASADPGDADSAAPAPDQSSDAATEDDDEPRPVDATETTDLTPAGTATLTGLLPADTRGIFAFDLETLLAGNSAAEIETLLDGQGADPAWNQLFGAVGTLAGAVDVPAVMTSAVLAQTTDAGDGFFLVAAVRADSIEEIVDGPAPTADGTHGVDREPLHVDDRGNHLALLDDGVLVVGSRPVVESVLDLADGSAAAEAHAIVPFLGALDPDAHVGFVYGLPALFDDDPTSDLTLRSAAVMSGALDVVDGAIGGSLSFHTANAAELVEVYNALNRPSTLGDDPLESPLTLAGPVADGLDQLLVPLPPSPLDASDGEIVTSRNLFRKLFVGMDAYDYAERVADRSEPSWLDFVVLSEQDDVAPRSPGSVFIRWEFRDEAARLAFEENELPRGFRLAPTRFLESDDPDGGYFVALNVYNAGGGSIVGGARAEWDVFVHGPAGADPDAGVRPRLMVVDVLSEEVSADPVNLLTPAEPLTHELVDGMVVSRIGRFENGAAVPVFESSFPVPGPDNAEVARFTREMAIGNDYIYWGHGVYDRALYNATTFNHDAYFVDVSRLEITDLSRWAEYLKPEVKDAVYYVNTLNYVASPMANLDSAHLDITPEWLAELVAFTTNGHQDGLMRSVVEQLFRGEADPLVGRHIGNETPSTYFHFEITDPDRLEEALDLPADLALAPTTLLDGGTPGHYLTLSLYEIDDALEGTRAEWSVYTADGSGRPPRLIVVGLMTADLAFDPATVFNLPSEVRHDLDDGMLSTNLSSPNITFEASFDLAGAVEQELSLDWIEAGDIVCSRNGICDSHYYDAETLDVAVLVADAVSVNAFDTPWNDFVDPTPALVFSRTNAQEYAVKRWYDLDVAVDELPFSGLEDPTHTISGTGTLVGRSSSVVDSEYTYTGDVALDGDQVYFALDQRIENALGVANIYTTGSFDLASASGTQTVIDCVGPALMCSDIENGSTAFYTAQQLDASDRAVITWRVDAAVDLGGSFGTADSASTFLATAIG